MTEQDLRKACHELMATVPAVYLTTIGLDGHPRIRAMLNLRNREMYPDKAHLFATHGEDFLIYLATNTSSRKRAELDADPRVGLYYCDPQRFFGLSLLGTARIVDDAPTREAVWADGWERYYSITGRPDDPDYTLVRVLPTAASGWTGRETFRFGVPR